MPQIVPIADIPAEQVEQLLDLAFGPDRRRRTAYRIRQGMAALPQLSFAARDAGRLIGTIQCWPIALAVDEGNDVPLVMLGPVAVDPARQQGGVGRMLTRHAIDATGSTGDAATFMLIGDPEYYGRFFGFTADHTGNWRTPGPVERHRLLARGPEVPDRAGLLGPRIAAHA